MLCSRCVLRKGAHLLGIREVYGFINSMEGVTNQIVLSPINVTSFSSISYCSNSEFWTSISFFNNDLNKTFNSLQTFFNPGRTRQDQSKYPDRGILPYPTHNGGQTQACQWSCPKSLSLLHKYSVITYQVYQNMTRLIDAVHEKLLTEGLYHEEM